MNKITAFSSLFIFLISTSIFSLPVDWHGTLGFNTSLITDYRRIDSTVDNSSGSNAGSRGTQEVPLGSGDNKNASWQGYIFKLEPTFLVNDSATIKSEFSSGYGRGGYLGDSSTQSKEPGYGSALYGHNFTNSNNNLVVNKLYMELYADTATYIIGRHSSHYALGAYQNSGDNTWDRLSSMRDGLTLKISLGNFKLEPYWARLGSGTTLTKGTRVKEIGFSLLYDNIEKDMAFGLLFAKKKSAPFSSNLSADTTGNLPSSSGNTLGKTDVKITDLYFKKAFGIFDFAVEVPILSGDIGTLFTTNINDSTKFNTKAIILESNLKVSDSWKLGLDGGKVNGEDGGASSFGAMYLHPNYQIANLLFRYNLRGVAAPNGNNPISLYDSYITNTMYLKLKAQYTTEKWTWDTAFIYAKALETAKVGATSFNHQTNKTFTANFDQSDDLGYEYDLSFNYQWNKEIKIGGDFGYLFTGDYFGYTNTSAKNQTKNTYVFQLKTSIDF